MFPVSLLAYNTLEILPDTCKSDNTYSADFHVRDSRYANS